MLLQRTFVAKGLLKKGFEGQMLLRKRLKCIVLLILI